MLGFLHDNAAGGKSLHFGVLLRWRRAPRRHLRAAPLLISTSVTRQIQGLTVRSVVVQKTRRGVGYPGRVVPATTYSHRLYSEREGGVARVGARQAGGVAQDWRDAFFLLCRPKLSGPKFDQHRINIIVFHTLSTSFGLGAIAPRPGDVVYEWKAMVFIRCWSNVGTEF